MSDGTCPPLTLRPATVEDLKAGATLYLRPGFLAEGPPVAIYTTYKWYGVDPYVVVEGPDGIGRTLHYFCVKAGPTDEAALLDSILDAYGVFPSDIPRLDVERARAQALQLIRDYIRGL